MLSCKKAVCVYCEYIISQETVGIFLALSVNKHAYMQHTESFNISAKLTKGFTVL